MLVDNDYLMILLGPLWFEGLEEKEWDERKINEEERKKQKWREKKREKERVWCFPGLPKKTID